MSFETETGRDLYFRQLEKELAALIDPKTGLLDPQYSREIPCPLCRSRQYDTLFIKRGYTFVRCTDCGMVYSNPQVLPDIALDTYEGGLSSTELWMKVLLNQKEISWRTTYFEDILNKIEVFTTRGELLDVGCGVGQFLTVARQCGWDVTGLELSKTGARYCRDQLGLNVIEKTIQDSSFGAGGFKAISLLGVLEHVTDPLDLLSHCRKNLGENGVVAAVVPNIYSLANMILRDKAVTFDGRNHLLYFSNDTIKQFFIRSGFEVVYEDTMLTGLPNIKKYIQFLHPYEDADTDRYLPQALKDLFNGKTAIDAESTILSMGLGLRLRMIGRKIA